MTEASHKDSRIKIPILLEADNVQFPVDREELIRELTIQRNTHTSSQFNLTFLTQLEARPDDDIADIWDDVESFFASKTHTSMRRNPYRSR